MNKLIKSLVAVAAIAVAGTAAAADPIDITGYTFKGLSGFAISGTVVHETVLAGEIDITSDKGSFKTYCIELTANLNVNDPYVLNPTYANDLVARLFKVSGFETPGGVVGNTNKAALQLAIWEAVYDGAPGSLTAGNFIVTGTNSSSNTAVAQAATFLSQADALAPGSYSTHLLSFESTGSQDLVTVVPEPGTYALMLAGLAGVGFVARRRSASRA